MSTFAKASVQMEKRASSSFPALVPHVSRAVEGDHEDSPHETEVCETGLVSQLCPVGTVRVASISRTFWRLDRSRCVLEGRESPRERAAIVLDTVLEHYELSHAAVARLWGCSEALVRAIRAGKKPFSLERIVLLPDDVAQSVMQGLTDLVMPRREDAEGEFSRALSEVAVAYGACVASNLRSDREGTAHAARVLKVTVARLEYTTRARKPGP